MQFYENLKDLMVERKIDVKKLEAKTGIDQSTIYYYLENKSFPNLNCLIKLSDYFNCSIDFLVGFTDNLSVSKNKSSKKFIDIYEQLLKEMKTHNTKLSASIGFSRARYYDWKKGVEPNISTLMQLSKHFNTSIEYLIGRSDDK